MKCSVFLISILFSLSIIGQQEYPNNIGKKYVFDAVDLKTDLEVQVYCSSKKQEKSDVLILLDGQRLFTLGVTLSQTFEQFHLSPGFIVVGVSTPYPERFGYFTSGSSKLNTFLKDQLIPFLTENYNISDRRILFGWEYGGSFAITSLIENPSLFSSYIAASAFPISSKVEKMDSLLENQAVFASLYFAVENEDGMVKSGNEKMNSMLKKKEQSIQWKYEVLENEEHRSTPYTALYHGLRNYYFYFPEIQFNTLKEFFNRGGLEYVNTYYEERAKYYGFSPHPTPWTMFSITRAAMRADDYAKFDELVSEFEDSNYLTNIRLSRALSVADFYRENQNTEKALEIYTLLSIENSDVVEPLVRLADLYKDLGDSRRSEKFYKLANKLNEKTN